MLDAMVLVGALAVWLGATRYFAARSNLRSIWVLREYGFVRILRDQIALLLIILAPALLWMRFRRPRPSARRLWRQPGLAACAATLGAVALKALSVVVFNHANLIPSDRFSLHFLWGGWSYCGPAVLGAWLSLIVTRRWRAERSAIDRLGRLVGAGWLMEFLIAEMPGSQWVPIVVNLLSR